MNRKRFFELVQNPSEINSQDLIDLEQLIENYPFFQTAIVLHCLGLKKKDSIHYESSLKKAAVYSRSRAKLKRLVMAVQNNDTSLQSSLEQVLPDTKSYVVFPEVKPKVEERKNEDISLLLPHEIEELRLTGKYKDVAEHAAKIAQEVDDQPKEQTVEQHQLIDQFLQNGPRSLQSNQDFFDAEMSSQKSEEDDDEIVSETLAKIHLQQGNYPKALEIYEKLCLGFPEKKTYFATQILDLRKRLKNQ